MNVGAINLVDCVRILCQGDSVGKKPPNINVGESVLVYLKDNAYKTGLLPEQIAELAQVAASKKYSDSVAISIIKCLIPRNYVPAVTFVKTVSWLCTKLLSNNLQVAFLKWLILVYEWIDDKDTVHSLYGMLFLFLDNDKLSPYICHLLYLMTRKEDVVLFRLRKLLDLILSAGPQPHYIGLISMYKMHSPHLVTFNIPRKIKVFFKKTDAKWLDIAWNIQRAVATDDHFSSKVEPDSLVWPAAKRRRKDIIINPPFPNLGDEPSKMTVEQIFSFDDFLTHFDKVQFPNQMSAVLRSRYLQHLMVLRRDEEALLRFNFWLKHTLQEELNTAPSGETRTRVTEFLNALLNFIYFVKEPVACLDECLSQYLLTWNGLDYKSQIFMLIAQLNITPFHRLNDFILEPLRKLFFCSPVYFKCQVISCFCEMLNNLTYSVYDVPAIKDEKDISSEDTPSFSKPSKRELLLTIKEFIQFVDNICTVALQMESDHVLLQHWVLCFFEQVSVLCQQYGVKFVQIPSSSIIYRLLFSVNAMILSRLCKLMVNYKDEFEYLKNGEKNPKDENFTDFPDGLDNINQFNRYILDVSDSLWRNRAFVDRTNSLCYSIPGVVTDSLNIAHINEKFSIQNHPALVYFAKKFLVQTQPDSQQNLNPNLIRGKIKTKYLEFLQQNKLQGIIIFLENFIKKKIS